MGSLFSLPSIITTVVMLLAIGFFVYRQITKKKNGVDNIETLTQIKPQTQAQATPKPSVTSGQVSLIKRINDNTVVITPVNNPESQIAAQQTQAVTVMEQPKPIGKYPAMVFGKTKIYFTKLVDPVGNIFTLDPSMPQKGEHFVVKEDKDGNYFPYDPREFAYLSDESPESAYDALNWYKDVNAVYANKFGLWDKINSLLIGLIFVGCFIVIIAAVGDK